MASAFKNHALKMAERANRIRPKYPEKLKGGRIEKIYGYFNNIFQDYKNAVIEIGQDMKSRPVKASIYVSALGAIGVLGATNPAQDDFKTQLISYSQDLLLIGEPIRNASANKHIQDTLFALKDGKLRFLSIGILTFVSKSEHSHSNSLHSAQCKQVNPRWRDFHKHVIDVGIHGRWINLDKAMKDYDINPTEWIQSDQKESLTAV